MLLLSIALIAVIGEGNLVEWGMDIFKLGTDSHSTDSECDSWMHCHRNTNEDE